MVESWPLADLVNSGSLIEPKFLDERSAWIGHIPFAGWLVTALRPGIFVELGTHTGVSYLSFCQAIQENKINTKAFAVDTWQGDKHSREYDKSVFLQLKEHHDPLYGSFSQLLKTTFDQAVNLFDDNSVDLLHIDGLHTYEAVKHDFEVWLPKLSSRGIVLFHDIQVYKEDFGVHKLWNELSTIYPSFSFEHCYGLGILLVGCNQLTLLREMASSYKSTLEFDLVKRLFANLGDNLEKKTRIDSLSKHISELQAQIFSLNQVVQERDEKIARLIQSVDA
jgi:hypothetical protein